jgi:hypothetical protein
MRPCLARDFQVSRVYFWEDDWGLSSYGKLKSMRAAELFLELLYKDSGLRPPEIRENRRLRVCLARYSTKGGIIEVAPGKGMYEGVILHEACHHLANHAVFPHKAIEQVAWHGPEFTGLLIYMGAALMGIKTKSAIERANNHGIQWRAPSPRGISIAQALRKKLAYKRFLEKKRKVALVQEGVSV